ncbi:MAG: 4-(cytidine 5'-diphospho)-2-C-methyl-D-erythritol kinase [Clostridiales bacterium]|nr:4-(cytidine 5'-diphospho)-2-C-methyl-D-erythritol kinase [Clostridiales bacterium]
MNPKQIELKAFAKINLSLDVQGLLDNGFHKVEMVMQQILLCDDVSVCWAPSEYKSGIDILLSTNKYYLPKDARNLAYKAALLMGDEFSGSDGAAWVSGGTVKIDIKKRIPVAAGLAGGSSDGAAVLHALNRLWNLNLSISELCILGAKLGSDVPFCIMGQAAANHNLMTGYKDDPLACHCALATGTGTELRPIKGLKSHLVLSKPPIAVSTAQVYKGIDTVEIPAHPDNDALLDALEINHRETIKKNMVNVLENFTLKSYPMIVYTKNKIQYLCKSGCVLMSGSGPTVFGLCDSMKEAKYICKQMLKDNKESYWTRTTW